jgi:predicted RND superfamily exporter protein
VPPKKETVAPQPIARRWLIVGVLVVVAGIGWAALPRLAIQANTEDIARGLPELAQAQYAEQVLGASGEVSVVLTGADVQSPRALQWLTSAEQTEIARYGGEFRPLLTAPDLLGFLGTTPTAEQVTAGLQLLPSYLTSAVFTPDGRQAMMIFGIQFQDIGPQAAMLDGVRKALPNPPAGMHVQLVGLPVAGTRAYELISADRYLTNAVAIVVAGLVLLVGLRRRRDALLAVLAAVLATGWTIAALWLAGQALNPLTVVLGSLVTVTACEFTVLLLDGPRRAGHPLRRMVIWAGATSAIGYLALVPSRIGLIREFGLTLALTVVFSYLAATAVVRLMPTQRRVRHEIPAVADVRIPNAGDHRGNTRPDRGRRRISTGPL